MNNIDLDLNELWQKMVSGLREDLQDKNIDIWLAPVKVLRLENQILYLKVPNKLFTDGIRERYHKRIQSSLRNLHGLDVELDYEVARDLKDVLPRMDPIEEFGPQSNFLLSELNPRYTFATFIVGASNRFARATAESVARNPGTQYNPFFIYGGVGLGKTHLMHAIGNALRKEHPRARVLYTTAEQFVNEFINSIHHKPDEFRTKYRNLDCLLIDDIQFLISKDRSEQEFFHTYNSLFESRKQIIVSSDRSPKEMSPLEQRLISRLEWGVVADIKPPDLETRIAILRKKAEIEDFDAPDDVVLFLASAIKSNIRALEGSLIRLKAFSCVSGSPLTIDDAKEILKDSLGSEETSPIRIETIQRVVAAKFNIDVKDIKGQQRTISVALPRQLAMYLSCVMTDLSLVEVGRHFGGKDHSTVHHAKKKIQGKMEGDPYTNALVNKLQSDIKAVENQ